MDYGFTDLRILNPSNPYFMDFLMDLESEYSMNFY